MATLYITSNADTGTGTLRTLCANAVEGDVIQPDPTIFPAGTVCSIQLSSYLYPNKNISIQGAQTRIEIKGGSKNLYFLFGSTNSSATTNVTLSDIDFIRLIRTENSPIFLRYARINVERCRAIGCSGTTSAAFHFANGDDSANHYCKYFDCAVYGNQSTATAGYIATAFYYKTSNNNNAIWRCTYGGNVSAKAGSGSYNVSDTGDNVTETSSWRTPPSASYDYSTWTMNSWQDMNPRLTTSATNKTGATSSSSSITDIAGNPRKTNGAKGAWEFVPYEQLATPTNFAASSIGATSLTLSWSAVANATSYKITYGANEVTTTGTSAQITGLTTGSSYTFHIVAINEFYLDSNENTITVTVQPTLYITSTANTGTGTLRTLCSNASHGDVIQPDPTTFPAGTVCSITFSSDFTLTKAIKIIGAQTYIVINGNNQYRFIIGNSSMKGNGALVFEDIVFKNLSRTSYGAISCYYGDSYTFRRCKFVGISAPRTSGVYVYDSNPDTVASFEDCAFYGGRATSTNEAVGLVVYYTTAHLAELGSLTRCTFGANVYQTSHSIHTNFPNTPTLVDCVSDGTSSSWRTPPSASYNYSSWTKDSWKSIDPRPSPTATWRTGSTTSSSSILDVEGLPRKTNGALGAWEYSPPLDTPTGLSVTNNDTISTAAQSTVSWSAVSNASSYKLEYKKSSASNWTSQSTTSTSVALSSLDRNTSYNFRVTAIGDGLLFFDSEPSSFVSKTTKSQLSIPTNLTLTNSTTSSLTYVWDAVPGTNIYNLGYKLPSATSWSYKQPTTNTATITGLTQGKTYNIRISARYPTSPSTVDGSPYTEPIDVVVLPMLATPSNIIYYETSTVLDVSWDSVANATSYTVALKLSTDSEWTETTSSHTWFDKLGLTPGASYDFKVKANGDANYLDSNYSAVVTVTMSAKKLSTPTGLTADQITSNSVRLGWNAVSNASDYLVEYRAQGASNWTQHQQS